MSALPDPIDITRQLVACPSVSSPEARFDQPNREVIHRLAELAEDAGFRVEIVPLVPGDDSKLNLIATKGDGPGGLVLSGHSDTVPYDESKWATDPFELVEREGKLFGLGSVDMKGFFAAALHATAGVEASTLKQPIVLLATADEESSMDGARALLDMGRPTATRALIGEPTGLAPVRMHKGILMESLRIEGRSGHSSDPALGRSALEAMHQAITSMLAWRENASARVDEAFAVPTTTMNLGRIEGGDSPNRICASCQLTYDIRPLPGMDLEDARAGLERAVRVGLAEAMKDDVLSLVFESLVPGVPAFETPADASIVRETESLTGQASRAVMFCTEAPFFVQMGMETLVCGAGSIDVAHQPNEYTTRDGIQAATELYAALVHRFCVEDS